MYIVTGGAGLIGSAVIWKLNTLGIRDILVVDNLSTSDKWKNLVGLRYAEYLHRDAFIERVRARSLSHSISCIFHLGACSATTERDVDFLFRNNLEYTKSLAAFALERGIRFVNASSAATYGDGTQGFDDDAAHLDELRPLNPYGYSKHLFDLWAKDEGLLDAIASVKFFNVYGPNEYHKGDMRSVPLKAFHEIGETGRIRLFASNDPAYPDGGQMRDFVYVKDCAEVLWFLAENRKAGGLFNLGTGTARCWNDLARAVFSAMELPENIEYIPMPDHLIGKYQNFTQARMDRLVNAGWSQGFTSLEDGVTDYVRMYLRRGGAHLEAD